MATETFCEEEQQTVSKLSRIAFFLGLGSIMLLPLAVLAAFKIEMLGLVDLLRTIVAPLSAAAAVIGLIAGNKALPEDFINKRRARLGLILGVVSFSLVIAFTIAVAIFFLPFLWA